MSLFNKQLPELQEVGEKLELIFIEHELNEYVPVYPLTNKLKFFDCRKCGKVDKKMFRLNLRNRKISTRINRWKHTIETHQTIIYLCPFCFDVSFSRFAEMIDDCENDRFEKYEFAKN